MREGTVPGDKPVERVGIIGLGYVGLPLAIAFAEAGLRVVGLDTSAERVAALADGRSYVEDVPSSLLASFVRSGHIIATTDGSALQGCQAILICVPTPLGKHREPDLSFVISAAETAIANLCNGHPDRPRVDDLAGHHARGAGPHARADRPDHRPGRVPGLQPGAGGPGERPLRDQADAQGRGWPHDELRRPRRGPVRPGLRPRAQGLLSRFSRDGQDPREHLPCREHRPRQRDGHPGGAHGRGRLGSHRGGSHEAVRLHALLAGSWPGRSLHPGRPVLPGLAGTRLRPQQRVRGAGRAGST